MNPVLKKGLLIIGYPIISIVFIFMALVWLSSVSEFSDGTGFYSLSPYENMVQTIANYMAGFGVMICIVVLVAFFVYVYALIKDNKNLAKKAGIVAGISIFSFYIGVSLITPIARLFY